MLQRGDLIPHFMVRTLDGDTFAYADIWQRKNLVLVLAGVADETAARCAARIADRRPEFDGAETVCLVTAERVDGFPRRGVVVADRWGEVVHVVGIGDDAPLGEPDELLDWASFTRMRCPECEGEAR